MQGRRRHFQWRRDYSRWLAWIVLIGVFAFIDSLKIEFARQNIFIAVFTLTCFAFVAAFYFLREKEKGGDGID